MSDNNINNEALGWDQDINEDGNDQEYVIVTEGNYYFEVTNFERGQYNGTSEKIPYGAPVAKLTIRIYLPDGGFAYCNKNLILCKSLEWQLSGFFRCIGQKAHGSSYKMNWQMVPGARGYAHFAPRTWKGIDGSEKSSNDIKRFIDWDDDRMEKWVESLPHENLASGGDDEWA